MRPESPSDNGQPRGSRSSRKGTAPPAVPPSRWGTALCALLGVTWVFAYAPEPVALAVVPGLIGWLAVIERSRSFREVMLWLVIIGAATTVLGYAWLAQTVQDFGGLSPAPAWVLTALFGIVGTAHAWVFALVYRAMASRGFRPHPMMTAILIAGAEALPIRLFAWTTGHGAVDVAPLLQAAEWGGITAVSFAMLCLVVPIYEWVRWAFVPGELASRPGAASFTFAVGVVILAVGAVRYGQVRQEERDAPAHLRVAIVQTNIGTHEKRNDTNGHVESRERTANAYRELSALAVEENVHLVVWPESTITDAVPMHDPTQTNGFLAGRKVGYGFLEKMGEKCAFLVGMYEQVLGRKSLVDDEQLRARHNVAALRQPGGRRATWSLYQKVYLIPFGEMTPYGLFDQFLPQGFPMLAGTLPQPLLELDVESTRRTFAPFICYEGILGDHVRKYVDGKRPDVLVSLTNDSWFGETWEPGQHLNFTRVRAVEHRAPMVRSTNTGISAFVSATGDVATDDRLEVGARGVLVREVPLVDRSPTLYVKVGYRLPWAFWIIGLVGWALAMLRPPRLRRA